MAVKARGEITLMSIVDIASSTRYYKLQSSTLAKPAKPTVNPPSGWVTTEPAYTAGATNSLYMCDLTVFSDGTWYYSDVSLSSSYDAAKDAYNKAVAAAKTATDYMDFGADGLTVGDMTSGTLAGNVRIASDGVEIRNGSSVLARLKAGILELAANSANAIIKLCGGKGTIAYYAETDQLAIMAPGSIAMTACQTLPDGTVQPWDAGIACNQYGVVAKGAVEVSGSLKVDRTNVSNIGSCITAFASQGVRTTASNVWCQGSFNGSRSSGYAFTYNADGTVSVNVTGWYFANLQAIFYDNANGDLMHFGIGTATNNILTSFQIRAAGTYDTGCKAELIRVTAGMRLRPYIKCEQGYPNGMFPNMTLLFVAAG